MTWAFLLFCSLFIIQSVFSPLDRSFPPDYYALNRFIYKTIKNSKTITISNCLGYPRKKSHPKPQFIDNVTKNLIWSPTTHD